MPSTRDPGRLHLFNLDLHRGPIGDFREITSPLGVDVTEWTMSAHADLIGRHREPVLGFNARNWRRLSPRVVDRFLDRYGRYLDQFDGFITTHTPAFADALSASQQADYRSVHDEVRATVHRSARVMALAR